MVFFYSIPIISAIHFREEARNFVANYCVNHGGITQQNLQFLNSNDATGLSSKLVEMREKIQSHQKIGTLLQAMIAIVTLVAIAILKKAPTSFAGIALLGTAALFLASALHSAYLGTKGLGEVGQYKPLL